MADYSDSISNTSESVEAGMNDILKDSESKIRGKEEDPSAADCDVCIQEGNKVIAEGYCVDCDEYLCAVCYSCHCRPKPSRGHVLQTKDEMPKPGSPKRTQHKSGTPCLIHPEKDVTHFCKTHDQLCCVLCISIGHSICPDIKVIADEAKDIEQSQQLNEFQADLSRIESTVLSKKQLAENNEKRLSIMKQKAVGAFNEELEKLSIPDKRKLHGVIEKCDIIGTELSSWKNRLQSLLEDKNPQQTYLFLNHTRKQLSCVDSEIQQACCDCSIEHFRFEKGTEKIECGKVIGKLLSYTPGKTIYITKIKISHADDKQKSRLRDIAILDNDLIICADEYNSCLKVVDVKQNSIQNKIALPKKPFQLASVSKDEIFVSTSLETIINVRNLTNLATLKSFEVQQCCSAIEWYDDTLTVVHVDGSVVGYDRNGKLLCVLEKGKTTYNQGCMYSTMDIKDGSMYLLSEVGCAVSKVQRNGEGTLVVQADELNAPAAIVYDDGYYELLVASYRGQCVFRVTLEGKLEKIISSLDFRPLSLAIDKQRRVLYVGGEREFIYQYQLC